MFFSDFRGTFCNNLNYLKTLGYMKLYLYTKNVMKLEKRMILKGGWALNNKVIFPQYNHLKRKLNLFIPPLPQTKWYQAKFKMRSHNYWIGDIMHIYHQWPMLIEFFIWMTCMDVCNKLVEMQVRLMVQTTSNIYM